MEGERMGHEIITGKHQENVYENQQIVHVRPTSKKDPNVSQRQL
jgi:hypothetical protein